MATNIKKLEEAYNNQAQKVNTEIEKLEKIKSEFFQAVAETQLKKAAELNVSISDYLELNG